MILLIIIYIYIKAFFVCKKNRVILNPYYLLLYANFELSFFFCLLRFKGRLYEIFFNVFITKNFLLSTAFAISPKLWYILLFSFVTKYFKISL